MGAEQAQRIGKKTGKWKGRFKKVVAGGLALGAVALGIKADNTITKIDRQQREEAGAYISGPYYLRRFWKYPPGAGMGRV